MKSSTEQQPENILTAFEIMCNTGETRADLSAIPLREIQKIDHPRLVYSDETSEYPRVGANDNTIPAGRVEADTCDIQLEVLWGDFYPETEDRPGIRVVVLGEKGKPPTIPAPLIRVKTGTTMRVSIHNTLTDSTVTIYGLQSRSLETMDSVVILQGETRTVTFEADASGTYLYWAKLGKGMDFDLGEEEQLSGAFIIDPAEGSPADRVLVMNIFSTQIDTLLHPYGWLEFLTINGKSWPFTELFYHSVGDTVRWRVINSSQRFHPMHLHGFYYYVTSRGGLLEDQQYDADYRPFVVTEAMQPWSTMGMEWITSRPGRWLFHCHLSFHVDDDQRLPGASARDPASHKGHMAGLVTGILVKPGPTDLIYKGDPSEITLSAKEFRIDNRDRFGFSLDREESTAEESATCPGPPLVLRQYQPTYITVQNQLSIPTSIHWHGLEIESWSDGVAIWSASEDKYSSEILPGDAFTYELALMRPGTFIYHSHFEDVHQLSGGLYGPLIVIGEDETYDPRTDHTYIYGWRNTDPETVNEIELNGRTEQPDQHVRTGEEHRLRLINIAPAGRIHLAMLKNGKPVAVTSIAKDGADLPDAQRVEIEVSQDFGVGETADFLFVPANPGIYTMEITENEIGHTWKQNWVVK